MNIRAEVTAFINNFTAEVRFSETAMSFYGPAWEIGLFFGLLPIKGKTKELLRIEFKDIEEVVVGKNTRPFNKKEACLIKVRNNPTKVKNNPPIEVAFTPFEPGRAMLYKYVGERFI